MRQQRTDLQRQRFASLLESDYDYTCPKRGQVRQAVILSVSENDVIVDLGTKRDGIVPRRDLELLDEMYRTSLQIGDRVPVRILTTSGRHDEIIVSLKQGLSQQDWLRAQAAMRYLACTWLDLCKRDQVMNERIRGHIQRFSHQRRCGIIRPDDGYPDIRVFLSDFRSAADASRVTPGDAVEFRIKHAPEGPMGVDVVVLKNGATTERVKGHVKWFDRQKRYGFIQRDDGLPDVFVHMNEFRSPANAYWVRDGDAVEFEVEQAPKGSKAVDVIVLKAG